jgi:hypothetical protein
LFIEEILVSTWAQGLFILNSEIAFPIKIQGTDRVQLIAIDVQQADLIDRQDILSLQKPRVRDEKAQQIRFTHAAQPNQAHTAL